MRITSTYRLGVAALAFASAAAVAPAVAHADIATPQSPTLTSFSQALGSSAGTDVCNIFTDVNCTTAALAAAEPAPTADGGLSTLWQNNIFWTCFDCQNPNYAASNPITVSEWTPLSIFPWIPDVFPGLWDLWANQSSETCFLGYSTTLGGPYAEPGQFVTQFSSKGCNGGFGN